MMISWLFYVFSFSSFCNGFLLDTNTQGLSGNLLNENRYDALLKLFMDERKARLQLQNYVIKQQQKIDTLGSLPDRMQKVENVTDNISNLENSTASIDEKYSKLERKCESLQHRQNQLESILKAAENRTLQLEEELSSLRQVKAINQLQNLANLQQQMQTVQNNVNYLTVTSQARGQDMISMYKDLTVNKQKLVMFENDQQQMNVNISVLEQTLKDNMTLIESSVSALENHNLVVNSTLEYIIEHNIHVGFTAFGQSTGYKAAGTILKFPDIKMSYGLANLSTFNNTGIFTCEKVGLYLVIITVMSGSSGDSSFSVYRNGSKISNSYYIGNSATASIEYNAGTGSILLQMNVNDNVYIKTINSNMLVYDYMSSFTVIKIK